MSQPNADATDPSRVSSKLGARERHVGSVSTGNEATECARGAGAPTRSQVQEEPDVDPSSRDHAGPALAGGDARDARVVDISAHRRATRTANGDVARGVTAPICVRHLQALLSDAKAVSGGQGESLDATEVADAGVDGRRARLAIAGKLADRLQAGLAGTRIEATYGVLERRVVACLRPGDSDAPLDVERAIRRYEPKMPEARWLPIERFVRSAVRDCSPASVFAARELLIATAQFADWHVRDQRSAVHHTTLQRTAVFTPARIKQFAEADHEDVAPATVGNYCSRLNGMTKTLNPAIITPTRAPIAPATGIAPFTDEEELALWQWTAAIENTDDRCATAVLFAGCLGAGLTAREVCDLRVSDIEVDDPVVLLHISAPRVRRVRVTEEFAEVFAEIAANEPADAFVFLPYRATSAKNTASNFLSRVSTGDVDVSTQRARATWICQRLAEGIDIRVLMRAMGVTDFSAIARYLSHVPDIDEADYRTQLRGMREAA